MKKFIVSISLLLSVFCGSALADNLYVISDGVLYEIEYDLETIDKGGFICNEVELPGEYYLL